MTNSRIETMILRLTDVVGTVIPSQCRIIHIPEFWLISWRNTSQLHLGAHFTRCHGPADGMEMAIHIGAIEIVYQVIGIIRGHGGRVVTLSPPTSEAGVRSPHGLKWESW